MELSECWRGQPTNVAASSLEAYGEHASYTNQCEELRGANTI